MFECLQDLDPSSLSLDCALWRLDALRVIAALVAGFLLGVAGCITQWVFRNPLAEPYVLGVTGGASLAGALALLSLWPLWAVNLASIAGALSLLALVLWVARRLDAMQTLLWGVMLSTLCGAAVTALMVLSPEAQFRGLVFWLIGDLSGVTQPLDLVFPLGAVVLLLVFLIFFSKSLAQLQLGDALAQSVGVAIARTRWLACAAAGVAVASAFGLAGGVGFVGLIAPLLAQRLCAALNAPQAAVPISAGLLGATLVLAADTVAQVLFAPQILPVGAVLGVIGAASLMILIVRARHV